MLIKPRDDARGKYCDSNGWEVFVSSGNRTTCMHDDENKQNEKALAQKVMRG